ncbi:hypothetical protein VOLCADRAFT_107344 [Volvox carteri f. nagariensis]|uniref:SET domain-containing protein n=1 Tax=Volvox carteri f. nagariensis TaxID=3068 RepID=D8UDE7_VOLCA|nr:uncharacterized protein VOLCADRAFT_107344 [Volvox carteri f. nagariensis]EFJ42251.1 hypothetical protein VOLCADRAFT_107344 [Volvox carteri f. nagariensis]|eukprot:XP_002956649.1 hypothetical protein VOLCADRAFT_107344 [Volvox carteri f. nagariensis]
MRPPGALLWPAEAATNRNEFASVLGLVQWAIANKIRFTGCRPDIRNGIRGVYATSDINEGNNLVAVPWQSSLVVRPGERCPFPDFIPQGVWSQLPWFAQLACKLLHERALGPASRFADYLPVLPERIDLPALWPAEHVRQLQSPYLEQQILDEQEEWAELYNRVRRHLDRRGLTCTDFFWSLSCVRSRTFAGPHIPTPMPAKVLVGAAVAGVVAAVTAAVPTEPAFAVTALLPAVLTASECIFAPWRDEFRVVAGEAVQRGQPVLISYGNQSNDALLQRYGFVQLDGNPHDRTVVLTAAGAPQQTLQAVAALLAMLADRRSQGPSQPGKPDLPSRGGACRSKQQKQLLQEQLAGGRGSAGAVG